MAETSIVKLLELEGKERLDPEYYGKNFIKLNRKVIKNPQSTRLGQFIKHGYRVVYWKTKTFPKEEKKDDDVYFLQAANIASDVPIIDSEGMKCVWKNDWIEYPEGRINHKEILVEVKGKAEKVVLVPEDFPSNTLVSGTLYKFTVKKNILPEFVLVYFLTKYGKGLRDRYKSNLLVSFVNKDDLYDLPIIEPDKEFQLKIQKKYLEFYDEMIKSNQLMEEAKKILLEELKFDQEIDFSNSYNTTISDITKSKRCDAEFFHPYYEEIKNKIKNYEHGYSSLFTSVSEIEPNFKPKNFPEKKFSYVELADVNLTSGLIDNFTVHRGEKIPSRAQRLLKKGDIILSRVAGSIECVALVQKEQDGFLASSGFFQFRMKDIPEELMLVMAKTKILQGQFLKESSGTILTSVPSNGPENCIIPKFPDDVQVKITSLVQESNNARNSAKEILNDAIQMIELKIENN